MALAGSCPPVPPGGHRPRSGANRSYAASRIESLDLIYRNALEAIGTQKGFVCYKLLTANPVALVLYDVINYG